VLADVQRDLHFRGTLGQRGVIGNVVTDSSAGN
jgi:hypothetical protein